MPLFDGVAGASFGIAVHKVFKEIDPSSVDIRELIQENVETQFASWSEVVDKTKISEGILKSIDSPLGDEFGGETLRSLGATHRLAELSFDFRLSHETTFKISDIGRLMLEFGELNSDLTELANRLVSLGVDNRQIAGYMTGSIDAVFRIIDGDKNARYIVSDYKSDQLHDPKAENENPLIHYHPERLTKPMVKKGYILQILVYSVALHRYLKWRQPEYDPEKHLGGAAYLFVRGMIGFETNESPARPYGVYFWRPPTKLILALDALFAGRPH
jgi:exodeoxyribonuclease V beta subunit